MHLGSSVLLATNNVNIYKSQPVTNQQMSPPEMLQGFLPFFRSDCPCPENAMNLFKESSYEKKRLKSHYYFVQHESYVKCI